MSDIIKRNALIVSPSGNFYGSEQVLYNHLQATTYRYRVYVPRKSQFYHKLKELNRHDVYTFTALPILYLKLFLRLFLKRNFTLYINEGGHIKYAKLIAKWLPSVKVVVHIRLVEDASVSRLGHLTSNVKLITISDYIEEMLPQTYESAKIYDPMTLQKESVAKKPHQNNLINVGIIGRVSNSKGVLNYAQFFEHYFKDEKKNLFHFIFFGDVTQSEPLAVNFFENYSSTIFPSIEFQGFVKDQERMFSSIDVVLHLNENEPLGRIGLESWSREIPFICFNSGGCGEINRVLGMTKFSVDFKHSWEEKVIVQLLNASCNFSENDRYIVKSNLQSYFSLERYVNALESHFKHSKN